MNGKHIPVIASIGLAIGGIFGIAGTFAPTASMRGVFWGIDGIALVVAAALLTVYFFRRGHDLVAAGFLVFAIGEGFILSGVGMDLAASVPSFGTGAGLWAAALLLISAPSVFPLAVRILGTIAALLFLITALRIFTGTQLLPIAEPLPFYAYPVFVATFAGWIWTLIKGRLANE